RYFTMTKPFLALCCFISIQILSGEPVTALTVKGERVEGPIAFAGNGAWRIGPTAFKDGELVFIRFAQDPPPPRVDSGIFLRGGSLITGSLVNLIGENAEISSSAFGPLKIKKDEFAGMFVPLPSGQLENMPALAHYSGVLGGALGSYGSVLTP